MTIIPRRSDPSLVRWAKWATAVTVALATLFGVGVATIKTGVQWASGPMVRDESRARQAADSIIVSRLEAMDRKQDQLAIALLFPEGSRQRSVMLQRMMNIQPMQVELPEGASGPGAKEKDK